VYESGAVTLMARDIIRRYRVTAGGRDTETVVDDSPESRTNRIVKTSSITTAPITGPGSNGFGSVNSRGGLLEGEAFPTPRHA
jgi:hypothetical protein